MEGIDEKKMRNFLFLFSFIFLILAFMVSLYFLFFLFISLYFLFKQLIDISKWKKILKKGLEKGIDSLDIFELNMLNTYINWN
jgi:hypothetical protein